MLKLLLTANAQGNYINAKKNSDFYSPGTYTYKSKYFHTIFKVNES